MNTLIIGFTASLLAGLATFVGALPVLLPIKLTGRVQGIMLGFGGGSHVSGYGIFFNSTWNRRGDRAKENLRPEPP